MYETDDSAKKLIDMAMRLEGLPRHTSVHAAGVVISPKPVDEFVPLSRASDGNITTQYTMVTLEELGLLKMDFLGLRTLTVIQNAIHGAFDVHDIDYNDKEVFDMISSWTHRRRVPVRKCGDEKLHERVKAAQYGRYYRGNFFVSSGTDGFYSEIYRGKK